MLSGQEIEVMDSLIIAVTGMAIVMFELAILACFIWVLSKVLAPFTKKKEAAKAAAEMPRVIECGLADDEMAAVMVAVCQETGLRPEQINIKSIEVSQS